MSVGRVLVVLLLFSASALAYIAPKVPGQGVLHETITLVPVVFEGDTETSFDCASAGLSLEQQAKCARYTLVITLDANGNITSINSHSLAQQQDWYTCNAGESIAPEPEPQCGSGSTFYAGGNGYTSCGQTYANGYSGCRVQWSGRNRDATISYARTGSAQTSGTIHNYLDNVYWGRWVSVQNGERCNWQTFGQWGQDSRASGGIGSDSCSGGARGAWAIGISYDPW